MADRPQLDFSAPRGDHPDAFQVIQQFQPAHAVFFGAHVAERGSACGPIAVAHAVNFARGMRGGDPINAGEAARTRPLLLNRRNGSMGHIAAAVADRSGAPNLWLVEGGIGGGFDVEDGNGLNTAASWTLWSWQMVVPSEAIWDAPGVALPQATVGVEVGRPSTRSPNLAPARNTRGVLISATCSRATGRFKGRGFIQLTGRFNYRAYGQLELVSAFDALPNNPEEDPQVIADLNNQIQRLETIRAHLTHDVADALQQADDTIDQPGPKDAVQAVVNELRRHSPEQMP